MDGMSPLLWERPVRWPVDGLSFDMRALRYVLAAAEEAIAGLGPDAQARGVICGGFTRHLAVHDFPFRPVSY